MTPTPALIRLSELERLCEDRISPFSDGKAIHYCWICGTGWWSDEVEQKHPAQCLREPLRALVELAKADIEMEACNGTDAILHYNEQRLIALAKFATEEPDGQPD